MSDLLPETINGCYICIAPEKFGEFPLECCVGKESGAGRKLDKEIDVAPFAGFMAGDGPEDADIFYPGPGGKYEYPVPFCRDPFVDVHDRFLVPDRYTVGIINALTSGGHVPDYPV